MNLREKVLRDFDAYVIELDRREKKALDQKRKKILSHVEEVEKLAKQIPELHEYLGLIDKIKKYVSAHAFLPESYKLALSLIVFEYCKLKKIKTEDLDDYLSS